MRDAIMNQAKFCTRDCVETAASVCVYQRGMLEMSGTMVRTVCRLEPLLTHLQVLHLIHNLLHHTLEFPHLRLEA